MDFGLVSLAVTYGRYSTDTFPLSTSLSSLAMVEFDYVVARTGWRTEHAYECSVCPSLEN